MADVKKVPGDMEKVVLRKNSGTGTQCRTLSWSHSPMQTSQPPKKRVRSDCVQSQVEKRRQNFLQSRNIKEMDENKDSGLESCVFDTSNSSDAVCQRRRLLFQRSLSLPDVVTSGSPVFKESPDVLDFDKNETSPEYARSKSEGDKITQKTAIEGQVVCSRTPFSRTVSFKPGDEIIQLGDNGNDSEHGSEENFSEHGNEGNVSEHGNEGRKYMRSKHTSSGYGSKSDSRSIASNNSSLSVDIFSSGEKDVESNEQEKEASKIVNAPCISLFEKDSNGSLCLNENIVAQLFNYPMPKLSPGTDTETISPFSQYCLDALELHKEKASPNVKKSTPGYVLPDEKQLKDELLRNHFQWQMEHLDEHGCAPEINFFDGFTPSPKISSTSPKREIPAKDVIAQEEEFKKTKEMFEERMAFTPEYNEELVESIERACRCRDDTCYDFKCKQMKELLDSLRDMINDYSADLKHTDKQLLFNLRCHSERCDDNCKVPWCRILSNISDWTVENAIKKIIDMEVTLMDSTQSSGKCVKISESCQKRYSGMIKEGCHWFSLMPLNRYKNVVLAKEIEAKNRRHWVIKKTYLIDYDQQIEVYKKLRTFVSPYVVEHHWAMESDTSLLTCTEFKSSGTLNRHLLEIPEDKREIVSWMVQVITGVLHLHKFDIIFLKWASKNIAINEKRRLQICDLSSSVLSTNQEAECDEMKRSLPPTIIPPEMEKNLLSDVTEKSDSWGCGCFLYELCNTKPVFHQLRHNKLEHQWARIFKSKMPHLPDGFARYQHILDKCWVKEPENRSSLEEIQSLFYAEVKRQPEQ